MLAGLQQNLLPDLPDYDTAISDPRYAKKPPFDAVSTSGSTTAIRATVNPEIPSNSSVATGGSVIAPPPPYSVAIGGVQVPEVATSSTQASRAIPEEVDNAPVVETAVEEVTQTSMPIVVESTNQDSVVAVVPVTTTANIASSNTVVDQATTP